MARRIRKLARRAAASVPLGLAFLGFALTAGPARAAPVIEIVHENPSYSTLAVDENGVAYGRSKVAGDTQQDNRLWRSTDEGRSWSVRYTFPSGAAIRYLSVLSTGTLIAHLDYGSFQLYRSGDGGASWTKVFSFPSGYRTLTAHSLTDYGGYAYLGSYNTLDSGNHTNWVWRSPDDGRTWSQVYQSTNHRHIHFLQANPHTGDLYVGYGDNASQSTIERSRDRGQSWQVVCGGFACTAVDIAFDPAGFAVFGQDHVWDADYVMRLNLTTLQLTQLARIAGPSYSASNLGNGVFLVGETHEPSGSVFDPADSNVHLYGSDDGAQSFGDVYQRPYQSSTGYIRMMVQFRYPSGNFPIQITGYGTIVARVGGSSPPPPPDTTPPASPSSFTATLAGSRVDLAWQNPPDTDFDHTRIVRKQGSAPSSPTDGTVLCDCTGTQTSDSAPPAGTTYYYAAYAYDAAGNVSSPAQTSVAGPPPPPPPPGSFDSFVTDPGCAACSAKIVASGELEAKIAGAADTLDTAYGLEDFGGASGLAGRLYTRTVLRLPAGQTVAANLALFQVRDVNDKLVFELYLAPDRTIRLWSTAGGLRSSSINLSSGVVLPNDGAATRRVEVSALRNDSVIVRVDGVARITLTGLSGATSGNPRSLRAGVDHYDGSSTAPVTVYHGAVGVSQAGWLGP